MQLNNPTVELHGQRWKVRDLRNQVQNLWELEWKLARWQPRPALIDMKGGSAFVTYSPAQREMIRFTYDGVDQLPSVVNRVRKYKVSGQFGEENVYMAYMRPLSNIGIFVGLRVNL